MNVMVRLVFTRFGRKKGELHKNRLYLGGNLPRLNRSGCVDINIGSVEGELASG